MKSKSKLEEFYDWINTATTGQVYLYHTGFLAQDRGTIIDVGSDMPLFIPNGDIHEIGKLAIDAFNTKRVHLFQRKIHDGVYEYIAMKRRAYERLW